MPRRSRRTERTDGKDEPTRFGWDETRQTRRSNRMHMTDTTDMRNRTLALSDSLSPRIRVCCEGDVSKMPLLAFCLVFYSSRSSRAVHGQFTAQFTACAILSYPRVLRCDGMVATFNYKNDEFYCTCAYVSKLKEARELLRELCRELDVNWT